jgi:hypothetical protein
VGGFVSQKAVVQRLFGVAEESQESKEIGNSRFSQESKEIGKSRFSGISIFHNV